MALELTRVDKGNGYHLVGVALDATTIGQILVADELLDQEGYREMLDLHVAHHRGQIDARERGGQ